MSTIWTPGGEYVPKQEPPAEPRGAPPHEGAGGRPSAGASGGPAGAEQPTQEQMEAALAEARAVLAAPVVDHVASHVMALFEVAAIHLQREAFTGGAEKPDLEEVRLAIDAMAALVEGLGERLGKYHASLADGLAQLRLAFVQATNAG